MQIQWTAPFGTVCELWVWAKAVTRRQGRIIQGPLATDRPELIADIGPRRPAPE